MTNADIQRIKELGTKYNWRERIIERRGSATEPPPSEPSIASVINPLIEFGDHLPYCAAMKDCGQATCTCGRDQAVADAKKYLAPNEHEGGEEK